MAGRPGTARSRNSAATRAAQAAQRVAARSGTAAGPASQHRGPSLLSILLSLVIVLIESLVILFGFGFWLGSMAMVSVLNEIRQHDFSAPMERVESYQGFFGALRKAGYSVQEGKPKILEGKTTYLWTVSPRHSDALCVFQWTHDLQTNEITAQTNAALLLDAKLGNIQLADLASYSFYDSNDMVARSIVDQNASLLKPERQLAQAPDQPLPETGVMPPLLTPEQAKARARHGKPAEAPAEGAAPGEEGQAPAEGQDGGGAVEVTPPEGGGGESPPSDGGGGGGGGGSPETPPEGGGD